MKDFSVFFINKFRWIDSSPMGTISTMNSLSMLSFARPVYLILNGDKSSDWRNEFTNRYLPVVPDDFHIVLRNNRFLFIKSNIFLYLKSLAIIFNSKDRNKRLIVISRNTTFLPYLVLLRYFFNAITLFETHGYHGNITLPGIPDPPFRPFMKTSWQYNKMEKLLINHISGLICIARPQMELYKTDFVKIPTILLPLGSPDPPFSKTEILSHASNRFTKKSIAYIGRLNHHIDYKLVFDAISTPENSDIVFWWIGLKPENKRMLEMEARQRNIEARVHLLEWVGHRTMIQLLDTEISGGLVAYKPSFQSVAITSPSKVFDYFSVGLPVLGPDMISVTDFVKSGSNGFIYENENPASLSKAIQSLFKHKNTYIELSVGALSTADYYSWNARSHRLMQFINTLAE